MSNPGAPGLYEAEGDIWYQTVGGLRRQLTKSNVTPANAQWPGATCYIDPTGALGDDGNSGLDAAHPLKNFAEFVTRMGGFSPVITQNLALVFLSSHLVNPAIDQVVFTPRIQNGAQVSMQGTLVQVQTGTLASVVATSRTSPGQRLTATFGAGLTQPTLIKNTTRGSFAWIDTNTSGNTWTLTEPMAETAAIPPQGNGGDDTWTTGDSYIAYVPTILNLRTWNPSWEDVSDGPPDTRPTLYACQVGVGFNPGSIDSAQCKIQLDGGAMYQVAIVSSTTIAQAFYTHGSRAAGQVINCFGCDTAARTEVVGALGNTSTTASGEGKLIHLGGGRLFLCLLANVLIDTDFTVVGSGRMVGTNLYGNFCIDGNSYLSIDSGHLAPVSGSATIWGFGGLICSGGCEVEVNSPAATFARCHNGYLMDGRFQGMAIDDSVSPSRIVTGVSLGGEGGPSLDLAIASGGFGGRVIGRNWSIITSNQVQTATPLLSGPQSSGQVTTGNATQTTALTYAMPSNTGGCYLAQITARNTATNKSANTLIAFGAQNLAGAAAILGTPQNLLTFANAQDASLAGVAAAISASGGNILVQVTGLAATNIQWSVTLTAVSA